MIIDTDVLIWYLRGDDGARKAVEDAVPFSMSVITYMELIQGMGNREESRLFQKQIQKWNIEIVQISREISSRATFYMQEYALSHSMKLTDALIAATATYLAAFDARGNSVAEQHFVGVGAVCSETAHPSRTSLLGTRAIRTAHRPILVLMLAWSSAAAETVHDIRSYRWPTADLADFRGLREETYREMIMPYHKRLTSAGR